MHCVSTIPTSHSPPVNTELQTPEPLASMRTDADAESRCDVVDLKKLQPLFEVEVAALETVPAAELGVGDVVYIKHDIDGKMVWYASVIGLRIGIGRQ